MKSVTIITGAPSRTTQDDTEVIVFDDLNKSDLSDIKQLIASPKMKVRRPYSSITTIPRPEVIICTNAFADKFNDIENIRFIKL